MKKGIILLAALFSLSMVSVQAKKNASGAWSEADRIVKNLKQVSFPKKTYNISDFGAVAATPQRPVKLAHDAINLAIITCSQQGGGTVVIPDSTYITGPITLKSNVNLHLSDGAVLKFSTDQSLYFPAVLTRWEGIDCYNAHPLIYAYGETNIALTGKGTLDAQGANENWWAMCGAAKYGWQPGMVAQKNGARAQLLEWGESGTPVFKRVFGPEDGMRPQFVNFYRCNTILIEDVELLNSPFWVLHPLFCEDLTVRGVKIYNRGPNGDGCDPESCKNVLIENCTFDTGDDCIAIKSGRNVDGRKWNTPSENIVVRKCHMVNGHGGVVVGSEISGGYRNLYVEDCTMDSPELERVIRIKTSSCRGGIIENIFVRNVTVGRCREAVLRINLDYEPKEVCQRGNNPIVRNVNLENVTCKESQFGVVLIGLEDVCNIYDVSVKNCDFTGVKGNKKTKDLNRMDGRFRNVTFDNMKLNGEAFPSPADR